MRAGAPDTGSTFMQRLGYYILGIAVGLMVLGWFQVQKMRAGQDAGAEAARGVQPDPSAEGRSPSGP